MSKKLGKTFDFEIGSKVFYIVGLIVRESEICMRILEETRMTISYRYKMLDSSWVDEPFIFTTREAALTSIVRSIDPKNNSGYVVVHESRL